MTAPDESPLAKLSSSDLGLPRVFAPVIRWLLGINRLVDAYRIIRRNAGPYSSPGNFSQSALEFLGVCFQPATAQIEFLRKIEGPLIFVANHPLGGVDGLILISILSEVRKEFRFMGSLMLRGLPELRPILLPVNVVQMAKSEATNFSALRETVRFLSEGGAIGIFPAGEVAELPSLTAKSAVDRVWSSHLGTFVKKSNAIVVPIYIEARTGRVFRYIGYIFPQLRIALLAQELLRRNPAVRVSIGEPISYRDSGMSAEEITSDCRRIVDSMRVR